MAAKDCTGPFDMVKCAVGGAVGNAAGAVAQGAIDKFVRSVADAVETLLSTLATVWMKVPSPVLTDGDRPSGVIAVITSNLAYYTFAFAMIGVLFAAGKMALTRRGDAAIPAVRMLVTLIVVSGAGAAVVSAGIAAGDAFAPWIVDRATGQQFSSGAATIITANMLVSGGSGIGLIVSLAALLGSIAQIMFMIFRSAMITVLMCVLPTIAATSATEGGSAALRKAGGWLLAFVLYKPVAAVVYAVGFLLLKGNPSGGASGLSPEQDTVMSMLLGLTVITLAALTLPALVKFVVPMASAGVSSMFSGAAVGAGALATGAAIVTMGGSAAAMGGGTAAKGAAGAASSSSGAGAAGATPSPAAATAMGSGSSAAGGVGAGSSPGAAAEPAGKSPVAASTESESAQAPAGGGRPVSQPQAGGSPAGGGTAPAGSNAAGGGAGGQSPQASGGGQPAAAGGAGPTTTPGPVRAGKAPAPAGRSSSTSRTPSPSTSPTRPAGPTSARTGAPPSGSAAPGSGAAPGKEPGSTPGRSAAGSAPAGGAAPAAGAGPAPGAGAAPRPQSAGRHRPAGGARRPGQQWVDAARAAADAAKTAGEGVDEGGDGPSGAAIQR